jgi:hypothetical protein
MKRREFVMALGGATAISRSRRTRIHQTTFVELRF